VLISPECFVSKMLGSSLIKSLKTFCQDYPA
jgi:hypothetical protein